MLEKLSGEEISRRIAVLAGWEMANDDSEIENRWTFPDFKSALLFVDRVGALAEAEQHHPDIELGWGKVRVRLSTHSAGGITEKDIVLAKKIDALAQQ